jgi:HEAT repeat protein
MDVPALVANLGSDDRMVRQNARLALVRIGSPAVKALTAALASGGDKVRWEAAKALLEIRDPAAAPALVVALEDRDSSVRWLAAEGLMAVGRPGVIPLLQALQSRPESTWLRQGAHHILRSFTDPGLRRDVAEVLAVLEDVEPAAQLPSAAHAALKALQHAAPSEGR